jgi:hypothetical protein
MGSVKLKTELLIGMLCLVISSPLEARPGEAFFSLPFRLINNLIIIPARINDSDTLYFILDTGLRKSIICELTSGETLDLNHTRSVRIQECGTGIPAEALLTVDNTLEIGDLRYDGQEFIILTENILRLSSRLGTRIHGMLNLAAFRSHVMEINYDQKMILFYQPGHYEEMSRPGEISILPMMDADGIPSVEVRVTDESGKPFKANLMLDTGAGNALCLYPRSIPGFTLPGDGRRCSLGCGIRGNIPGIVGRMKNLGIGQYPLWDVPVSFPDSLRSNSPGHAIHGSLGAKILKRFNLVLNFPEGEIGFRPGESFGKDFQCNMSGIELIAPVPGERSYVISRIRINSGAERAGIRPEDELLAINGVPVSRYGMDALYNALLGKEGQKIILTLRRDRDIYRARYRLESYI